MNVTSARSSTTAWPSRRMRESSRAISGAVAMSSSPCTTSSRSPCRSATSVTFQLVGRESGVPGNVPDGDSVAAQDEPDARVAVRVDAPAVRQAAHEEQPEAAGLVGRAGARGGREAVPVVDDLDAHLAVPAGAQLERQLVPAVADGVGHQLRDEQAERVDLPFAQDRADRLEHAGARLGDRSGLRRELEFASAAVLHSSRTCPGSLTGKPCTFRVVTPYAARMPELPITTANELPGMTVRENLGIAFGLVVRSMGFAKGFSAGLKALRQGEISRYTELLEDSRRHALDRMVANARLLRANGIVAMRFDTSEVGQQLTEIVAYGTAVVVAPRS